jgi:ATP-binding cassette, subfamily B, heavy metal transporter
VKGVDFLLRFLLFSIGPLILELALVGGHLLPLRRLVPGGVVAVTIALYIWFTFKVTEWRVKIRKRDERAGHRRQPEGHRQPAELRDGEVFRGRAARGARYDGAMEGYEEAAVRPTTSLAFLNFGQSLIITAGLVA